MRIAKLASIYQFFWMLESHHQQRLAWEDAVEARNARMRAEARAALQHRQMLEANPSGQLGNAQLNEWDALMRSGLL